jgi:putative superfamily III holin-X
MAVHWACLVVAAVLAVLAAVGFAHGRSASHQSLTPDRSVKQIREDIQTAKEVLT